MGALAQRLKPVLMPALLALLLALLPGRAWLPGDWRLVEGLTAFTPQWLALALALGVRALWRGQRLRALVFVLLATPDLVSALRPEAGRPEGGTLAAPARTSPCMRRILGRTRRPWGWRWSRFRRRRRM